MKNLISLLVAALASLLLGGCSGAGSSAEPPAEFTATAGDGRVVLNWSYDPTINYWVFTATDPSLTAFNWTSLPNNHAYPSAAPPFYLCGLLNDAEYFFAINGRTGGGPGGPSSQTIGATPYRAGSMWTSNTATPLAQNASSPNLYGAGYASLTTCWNTSGSATGNFAAVGANGAIFTSPDGMTWTSGTPPPGFSSDLYAVTGYAANQNNPTNPGLLWVAVGAGGVTIYSIDGGKTWSVGRALAPASSLPNPDLHALIHVGATFFAVGDSGTILTSADGHNWITQASNTTNNLHGVTHGGIYVAVGDNGTILTSSNGGNWIPVNSGTTNNLRAVTSVGSIYVAVGDAGTIVTSIDGGGTWSAQTLYGAPNMTGIASETQFEYNVTATDYPVLGFVPNAQFVAIDGASNVYTSQDGLTWPVAGGTPTGAANLNSIVASGFGYIAVGNGGIVATSF